MNRKEHGPYLSVIGRRLRSRPERKRSSFWLCMTSIGHAKMMNDRIGIDSSENRLDASRLSDKAFSG